MTFNDEHHGVGHAGTISLIPDLTLQTYVPDGETALYDAIVERTLAMKIVMEQAKFGPERVLIVILTDGQDTVSRLKAEDVRGMMAHHRRKYGYEFAFMTVGVDKATTEHMARIMGGEELVTNSRSFGGTPAAMLEAMRSVGQSTVCFSSGEMPPTGASFWDLGKKKTPTTGSGKKRTTGHGNK